MRHKGIRGLVAVVALVALGASIATAEDDGPSLAPEVREIEVNIAGVDRTTAPGAANQRGKNTKRKRPKVVYLHGQPVTVDPGDPAAGDHVDIALSSRACAGKARIIDGGAVASRSDVYQQGTYIDEQNREYHVLLGIAATAPDDPYTVASHLICIKGVR